MADETTLPHIHVDVVVFTLCHRDLKVCLIPSQGDVWRLPGGGVGMDEALEAAAQRHLSDTTSVQPPFLQQLYTVGAPERDPATRMISVVYFALIAAEKLPNDCQDKGKGMAWHSVYQLPALMLDHADIVDYALTRLRYKIEYSAVAFELMPEEFTLRELQDAYMIILNDHRLDKANFRKKLREADILEPVSRYRETRGRPAKLFRFRSDAQLEIKARRFFP
jgi:8-oxo-dGTP diphosphatase